MGVLEIHQCIVQKFQISPQYLLIGDGEGMQWKYILAIVVGVIALLLITAVIVIAVRRKDKSKFLDLSFKSSP